MTQRFLHLAKCWLMAAVLACTALAAAAPAARAADVEVRQAQIESSEYGYRLASSFGFDLNRGLEEAVENGFALYFTTELELTRRRWYWFDEKTISVTQTIRISYNLLTRHYNVAITNPSTTGRLQQSFPTLEEALALVRRPGRWVVAEKGALKPGETYQAAIRMRLDLAQLPKPFQIHAINNADWRLSSGWKNFTYKAE